MIDPEATLKQVMAAVIAKFGTAAVLADLAVHVAWNARFVPPSAHDDVAGAGRKMLEALAVIENVEAMEASEDEKQAA